MRMILLLSLIPMLVCTAFAQEYDLLLKGGHVIDPRSKLSALRDVAIKDGKIASVASGIEASRAFKSVDVSGLYVTPGLIDIHAHVYRPTVGRTFGADSNAVYPDGFSFRTGVTTFVDPGGSGWRNFEDMKERIIDRSKTRVLAMINIVGRGSAGGRYEQDLGDMEVKPTAEMALKYKGLIVGVKSAHYAGPEWDPFVRASEVGKIANIPVMVDFGTSRDRTIKELFEKHFRPGDIYTHCYAGGGRGEMIKGKINPAIFAAQKKGIIFDIGHGGGSFVFRTAVQAFKEGFYPDSISTDLHVGSMNAGMKDMLNVMNKFLALGMSLDDIIIRATWNPAREIKHEELGNLSVGAIADVAVLRMEKGKFGFVDQHGARMAGTQRLAAEMTLKDGKIVYDLNGLARPEWSTLPPNYGPTGDVRWDGTIGGSRGRGRGSPARGSSPLPR
jgi:dihydroorotase